MFQTLDQRPGVGIVGAQILNGDGTFQASFANFPSLIGELLLAAKLARIVYSPAYPNYSSDQSQHEATCDWISGACLMARAATVAQIGGLDEEYFMYTEETDWCYRAKQAGWLVYYQPRAKVVHWGSQSSKRVPERRRGQVYRSKWLFMRKHRGPVIANAFLVCLWVLSAMKLAFWGLRSLAPNAGARQLARLHVRSYGIVLTSLSSGRS
jgi:GT2 family glycosyltransferase